MKTTTLALAFAAAVMAGSAASAQALKLAQATADDVKWINQCLKDNEDAKVSVDIVRKYCVCMNNKMSNDETRSITQWEKANPAARAACDKEAGWR